MIARLLAQDPLKSGLARAAFERVLLAGAFGLAFALVLGLAGS